MRAAFNSFLALLTRLADLRRPYVAKRPHLIVRRTDSPIDYVEHKHRTVALYGVEYEDRARYRPHIGAKQRRKAALA